MKKRRVGTLSMAALLIASGFMMFIAQFNKAQVIDIALKGWPIILFLLGGEILWYSYKAKDENSKIKYDLFSIFIICIIVVFNLTIYSLIQFDVVSKVNMMISSQDYTLKTPYEEFELDPSIKKIVVDAPDFCKLIVRTNEGNKITASGTTRITADSKEIAEKLVKTKNIVTKKSGNTLYLSFNMASSRSNLIYNDCMENYTIILPLDRKVEINDGNRLELLIDDLNNDWVIDGRFDTLVRLGENVNVAIDGFVKNEEDFGGNVQWNIPQKQETNEETQTPSRTIKGEIIKGNGKHKIHILNSRQLIVNAI
ncbi:hypothetical protein IZY60_12410 [Lutibacter sp. B2]|nr:hypothetical protein [Lutibacter sp. B2]